MTQHRTAQSKAAMLQAMVGHVLEHGLADASLRPLARAAQTSDRMLIYHFGSKQGLIGEILLALAALFDQVLTSQFAARRAESRQACLRAVAAITRAPTLRPLMRVWMQVLAAAAAGETAHVDTGRAIVARLLSWIEAHLPADDTDPVHAAQTMLVLVEGAVVLDLAGRADVADAALAAAFPD
jgi:AcrR family transcriptional regulator